MEKKTVGKFISALRKANGMTQKELGERLFVSDKTVSRWECDECAPELSLIPSIAEIFGITTDELLRGERNNPDREAGISEEAAGKQRAKSDRQFRLMLDRTGRKYKNLTLVSVGLTVLGLLAALITNAGFSMGLMAFCLATAFCLASEICQICFAVNARILPDEDEDPYRARIQSANTGVINTAVIVTFMNLLSFCFCLPLVTRIKTGLVFEYWLGYGLLCAAVAFLLCYIFYALVVRRILCRKGLTVFSEKQTVIMKKNSRLLVRVAGIAAAVALVLGVCVTVWNRVGWDLTLKELTFDSWADFKAFVENDYDKWVESGFSYIDLEGNFVMQTPADFSCTATLPDGEEFPQDRVYPQKNTTLIKNSRGEVICEYYYNPDLYKRITFNESSDDRMPVTVLTNQAYYDGRDTFRAVETVLYALIVIDVLSAMAIYLIKAHKNGVRV